MSRTDNSSQNQARCGRPCTACVLLVVWMLLILGGFGLVTQYEFTATQAAAAEAIHVSPMWTDLSSASAAEDDRSAGWTLTVALHPKCPCSAATMTQIEEISRQFPSLTLRFLVFRPTDGQTWEDTPLLRRAKALRSELIDDPDGRLAASEGLPASGATQLLDPDGQVCFRGGLTSSRGHEGRSLGTQSVEQLLSGRLATASTTPAYGCPVRD